MEIIIKNSDLEKKFGHRIKEHFTCLGVDTASRTGWCIARTTATHTVFTFGFIEVKSKDLYFKYDYMVDTFGDLLKDIPKHDSLVVIEDVFFSHSVHVVKMLARIGMIVYTLTKLKDLPKTYILATEARKKLGFKGNLKKEIIQEQFVKKLGIKVTDNDIVDAIILALNGILKPQETLL